MQAKVLWLIFFIFFLFSNRLYADELYEESANYSSTQEEYSYQDRANFAADNLVRNEEYAVNNERYYRTYTTRTRTVTTSRKMRARLPDQITTAEKVIIIDPNIHQWAAYSAEGKRLRYGLVTAGARWCHDIGRPCKTRAGVFRIFSLGSRGCFSRKYPIGEGGAPMPYCMFFNGGQGLHGSYELAYANLSHGCVRVSVSDAAWIRFNFAKVGTKVIVRAY